MANGKLLLIALSVFSWGCGNADEQLVSEFSGLKIKTVDENHQAFKVQAVIWWYPGKQEKIYQLPCKTRLCAEWVIEAEVSAPIIIRADASIEKQNDETCWDLYSGKAIVDEVTREVHVVMTYSGAACASQKTIRR